MSSESNYAPDKSSSKLGRALPIFLALLASGGLVYWFIKPKPDIRYARSDVEVRSQIQPGGTVAMRLERGAEIEVILTKDLNGWAMVSVPPSSLGFIRLSDLDVDRRPVLTGAYRAKALAQAISLREEPNAMTAKVDDIPARTMIQIWGYTDTPSGKWAEVSRYKDKRIGYILRDELEAASD